MKTAFYAIYRRGKRGTDNIVAIHNEHPKIDEERFEVVKYQEVEHHAYASLDENKETW